MIYIDIRISRHIFLQRQIVVSCVEVKKKQIPGKNLLKVVKF